MSLIRSIEIRAIIKYKMAANHIPPMNARESASKTGSHFPKILATGYANTMKMKAILNVVMDQSGPKNFRAVIAFV
jgi:hypothetical protein